jgi:hypothetical protein
VSQHKVAEPGTSEAEAGLQITEDVAPRLIISPVQGFANVPQTRLPPSCTEKPVQPFGFGTAYWKGPEILFGFPTRLFGNGSILEFTRSKPVVFGFVYVSLCVANTLVLFGPNPFAN